MNHWSGVPYFMGQAFEKQGIAVSYVGPLRSNLLLRLYEKGRRLRYLPSGCRYLTGRTRRLARAYARQIGPKLQASGADVVFSPGTLPVSQLLCGQPVVFWTDATFAGMVDYYPGFKNLCEESLREGNALEQAALDRCRLAIYSSEWAAQTALENYSVDGAKIKVVPFGANLESAPTEPEVGGAIASRSRQVCRLLFISVEWQRKGGDKVLEILEHLRGQGLPVELSIIGEPPPVPLPENVRVHGFVSKSSPEGNRKLAALLSASHFLLAPSRAEAFGLASAEANAFGVPALSSNTGGVGSVIRDGVNGQKFAPDAPAREYADFIARLWAHRAAYEDLALASYREFQKRLNWSAAGAHVRALLESVL